MVEYEIFLSNILLHIYINQFVDEKPKPTKQRLHFVRPILFSFRFFSILYICWYFKWFFHAFLCMFIHLDIVKWPHSSDRFRVLLFFYFILFYNFEGKKLHCYQYLRWLQEENKTELNGNFKNKTHLPLNKSLTSVQIRH